MGMQGNASRGQSLVQYLIVVAAIVLAVVAWLVLQRVVKAKHEERASQLIDRAAAELSADKSAAQATAKGATNMIRDL